jgi:hypothetical protein
LRKHQGGSRSGLSGINRPVKNLNRNPRQPNQLLSQQNRHKTDMLLQSPHVGCWGMTDVDQMSPEVRV